jgi:hypothetical protein
METKPAGERRRIVLSGAILLALVAGLLAYKSGSALAVLRHAASAGTLGLNADSLLIRSASSPYDLLARSITYLTIVGPALLFGILISGAVRAFVSPRWLVQTLGRSPVREQLAAGVAGAPLMLCSCCVAPIFSAVYERSRRLGPALAVALAAPSLNPAALALTFMLFPLGVATSRLMMGLVAVFAIAPLIARLAGAASLNARGAPRAAAPRLGSSSFGKLLTTLRSSNGSPQPQALPRFLSSSLHVAVRTVPLILAGVVLATWLAERLPIETFASPGAKILVVAGASLIALPMVLPTFFEIPLAFTLVGTGAPAGVAAAVLFAGPAINLPSLLTIGRASGWNVAAALAVAIALLAFTGGLLVG